MDDDGLDDLLNEIDNETKQIVQTVKASSTHQRKKKKTNLSITKPTLAVSNAVQDFNHSVSASNLVFTQHALPRFTVEIHAD